MCGLSFISLFFNDGVVGSIVCRVEILEFNYLELNFSFVIIIMDILDFLVFC